MTSHHCLHTVSHKFPGRQTIAHAKMIHGNAVAQGNGVELKGNTPCFSHGLFDLYGKFIQVGMPRHDFGEGVGNGDKRFLKVCFLHYSAGGP